MQIREAQQADAAGIAHVYVNGWRTTYVGIIPQEYLDRMSYAHFERHWATLLAQKDGFFYVAEDDTLGIIGFIWGGPAHQGDDVYTGELHAIYIDKNASQRGLGRLLVQRLAQQLVQQGIAAMIVWVLAANASRRFYERMGAQFLRTGPYYVEGIAYDYTAYGWPDLRVLL